MRHNLKPVFILSLLLGCFLIPSTAKAQFSIELDLSDFGVTDVFGQVTTLDLDIDVAGPLVAGQVYNDPALNGVVYDVFGILDQANVPSGFPAFNLSRTIGGLEFFSQGSSLNFEVASSANLADGLQASELVADAKSSYLLMAPDQSKTATTRAASTQSIISLSMWISETSLLPIFRSHRILPWLLYPNRRRCLLCWLLVRSGCCADDGFDNQLVELKKLKQPLWIPSCWLLPALLSRTERLDLVAKALEASISTVWSGETQDTRAGRV